MHRQVAHEAGERIERDELPCADRGKVGQPGPPLEFDEDCGVSAGRAYVQNMLSVTSYASTPLRRIECGEMTMLQKLNWLAIVPNSYGRFDSLNTMCTQSLPMSAFLAACVGSLGRFGMSVAVWKTICLMLSFQMYAYLSLIHI